MATGIAKNMWADVGSELRGFTLIPVGTHDVQITANKQGYSEKKQEEYVMFAFTYIGDDETKYDHWEFFSLAMDKLKFLRGFIEAVGRHDILESEESDWDDLNGTIFQAEFTHREWQGEKRSNCNMRTVINLSHEDGHLSEEYSTEETKEEESPVAEEPIKPAKNARPKVKATPIKPTRRRTQKDD